MSNIKGIIFNKEFDELFTDKKIVASKQILEEAILGLGAMKKIVGPILRKYNYEGLGNEDEMELRLHLDLAVKALEKQVPNKVVKFYHFDNIIGTFGECSACGHTGIEKYKHDFCYWCGQKLDWREDNA